MKANKAEQQALITLLNRIYGEICVIEKEWDIRVDAKDFRPRIEYFHDAIRALTSGSSQGRGKGRLSVEFLAYDISMLRHIQANPLARGKNAKNLSPKTDLVMADFGASERKSDSGVRAALSDHYKNYAVLFAALLSDTADRDYQDRLNECNSEVEDLAALEQMLKAASQKKDVPVDIEALVTEQGIDSDLTNKILFLIHNNKQRKRVMASEAMRKFKDLMDASDKEIKSVEKAHFTYVTSQLAVYELAKDVVKKMAQTGMNIVGNFVESAVQAATRGQRAR